MDSIIRDNIAVAIRWSELEVTKPARPGMSVSAEISDCRFQHSELDFRIQNSKINLKSERCNLSGRFMRPRERAEPTAAEDGVSGRNRTPTRARKSECERGFMNRRASVTSTWASRQSAAGPG